MGLHMVKAVPTPEEIRAAHPMDKELQEIKAKRDAEIKKIFTGESDKFIAIIGPCSAEFGARLSLQTGSCCREDQG